MKEETIQQIMDTLFTLETIKSKSFVHITQWQAKEILALKSKYQKLEEAFEELMGKANLNDHGVNYWLTKAGLI